MTEIHVTWLQDLQFVATDSTNHSVVMSRPGEGSVGMKPSELLLVALAGCTGVDVVNIVFKKRVKLTGVRINVSGEQAPDPPWPFQKIHIHYEVSGSGISTEAVERAIKLSAEKYCSVAATLRPTVAITQDYEIKELG